MRILLIEDNEDHAYLISGVAQVAFEGDAKIEWETLLFPGLEKLNSQHYDLCLCDLNLPDSKIEDTITQLQLIDVTVPVIVLTSNSDIDYANRLIQQGIQDFLPKQNLNGEIFLRAANYAIERKRYTVLIENKNREQLALCRGLSQDFKAPLRKIAFISGELKNQLSSDALLSEQQIANFEYIENEITLVRNLVKDLYQFLNLDYVTCSINSLSLDTIVSEARKRLKEVDLNDAEFAADNLGSIGGDKDLLLVLFQHLFSNAIKYNQRRPKITIENSIDNGFNIVEVSDNGIGIEEKYLNGLFNSFHQIQGHQSNSDGQSKSMGLGLSTIKRIVELHNGSISVQSVYGEGTSFQIHLPIVSNTSQ